MITIDSTICFFYLLKINFGVWMLAQLKVVLQNPRRPKNLLIIVAWFMHGMLTLDENSKLLQRAMPQKS